MAGHRIGKRSRSDQTARRVSSSYAFAYKSLLLLIPAAALFSFIGSYVASYLSGTFLRDFVGSVIIVVGVITVVKGWRARESES